MRQILVNPKLKKIFLEDVPAPILTDNGALIQVQYSLISSGTELASLRQSDSSYVKRLVTESGFTKRAFNFLKREGLKGLIDVVHGERDFHPTGYSGAGIVIDVGKKVTDLEVGDRVAYAGSRHAEIVFAPRNYIVKLPNNIDLREAAFTALGSIAMQATRRAEVRLGDTVLLVGLGLVGQLVNQLLYVSGCRVIGSDLSELRLGLSKEFGLERKITSGTMDVIKEVMDYTDQVGVDAVIICAQSSSSEIVNQAMKACREKGRVVIVGSVGLNLERQPFYTNELDVVISRGYGPGYYDRKYIENGIDYPIGYIKWTANRNMAEFIRLISEAKVNVQRLISREFHITEAQTAYETLLGGQEDIIAVLLKYDKSEVVKPISRTVLISKSTMAKNKDRVNIAVIGAGGISKGYHLPHLKKIKDANIYAIASNTGINAQNTAKQYGAIYCTTDYKEILQDEQTDCVLIATRHNLHKDMIIESAKAGKSIYVEKPMAMDYESVRNIIKVIKETGVIFTVGTNRRYSPLSQMAKKVIREKDGPVLINYRVNTTTLPLGHWVNDPNEGGGRIIGESPHFFDLMYWLLDSEPVRIYAERVETGKNGIIKDNNIVSTIKFANGSIVSLSYCDFGNSEFSKEKIEIFVSGIAIEIDGFREIKLSNGKHKKYDFLNIGLYEQMANFIQVVRGKKDLDLGLADGVRSTICALKVLDSIKAGKPVDVNLAEYF